MNHELVIGKYTLESLTNGMYASPLDMYREYIQNAVDSIDEAVKLELARPGKFRIDIDVSPEGKRIEIRDNACGISAENAIPALMDIGNSKKDHETSRGFRGIGRLAGLSYCDRLIFKTSYRGEDICSVVEFDAKLLRELLIPGSELTSVADVINRVVTTHTEKEAPSSRYFKVVLDGVEDETGLTNIDNVLQYLVQNAPLYFNSTVFKWGRTIEEKIRLKGYNIPAYHIFLNGTELLKPYEDTFFSDRVRKKPDIIQDVDVKTFYRGSTLSAILWYAMINFYGTISDNLIKGIRIRQGNILIGGRQTCSSFFKEERFNGWMIGELYVLDSDLIANARRDGFEKNAAYFDLVKQLRGWTFGVSKGIRKISYERSLTAEKKEIAEAETLDDINDENGLFSEEIDIVEDDSESTLMDKDESEELAETDYISKLDMLLNQKRAQTKYAALNINAKLTAEERRVLERVFDIISREYDGAVADQFINSISKQF